MKIAKEPIDIFGYQIPRDATIEEVVYYLELIDDESQKIEEDARAREAGERIPMTAEARRAIMQNLEVIANAIRLRLEVEITAKDLFRRHIPSMAKVSKAAADLVADVNEIISQENEKNAESPEVETPKRPRGRPPQSQTGTPQN